MSQRGEYVGLDTSTPGNAVLVKGDSPVAAAPAPSSAFTSGVFLGSAGVGLLAAASLAWWGVQAWRHRGTALDRAFRAAARGLGLSRAARVEVRSLAVREGVAAIALLLSPTALAKARAGGKAAESVRAPAEPRRPERRNR